MTGVADRIAYSSCIFYRFLVVSLSGISVLFSTFTLSLPRDCTKFVLPLVNLGGTVSEDKIEQTQSEKKSLRRVFASFVSKN